MKPALILFLLIAAFSSLAPKPEAIPDLQIEMKVYYHGKLVKTDYSPTWEHPVDGMADYDKKGNMVMQADSVHYSISRPNKYNPLQNWK